MIPSRFRGRDLLCLSEEIERERQRLRDEREAAPLDLHDYLHADEPSTRSTAQRAAQSRRTNAMPETRRKSIEADARRFALWQVRDRARRA